MAHLTHRDIQDLQNCVRNIYSDLEPDAWHSRLISAISKMVSSNSISYNNINPIEQKVIYHQKPSVYVSPKDIPIYEKYMHDHPIMKILYPALTKRHPFKDDIKGRIRRIDSSYIKHPEGRAMKISDMLTDNQFRSLGLYNEFYRKYDTEYQICLPLSYGPNAGEGIAVNRNRRDFTERDRLMLNLLGPHIIQAYKNAESHAKARRTLAILESSNQSIKPSGLTYREEDVLYWVAQGNTNADVAKLLNIAPGTVKIHLEKIYQKLGVENRTAAARLVKVEKL